MLETNISIEKNIGNILSRLKVLTTSLNPLNSALALGRTIVRM